MKNLISLLLILFMLTALLCACSGNTPPTESPTSAPSTEPSTAARSTESLNWSKQTCLSFDSIIANTQFTGAVYAAYKGETLYTFGNGKADKTADIPNSPDVAYCAASLTKQFTAAAILRLCEQGKLSLSDPVARYFPDYEAGANITILQLLSMQSGIEDYTRLYDSNGYEIGSKQTSDIPGVSPDNTAAENRTVIEQFIFSRPLLFTPGARYSYSNSNYVLLGGIIEQVASQSYHDYIKENFFLPLHLDSAGFADEYDNPAYIFAKANHPEGKLQYMSYPGGSFACGELVISPRDMARWTEALHSGTILGDKMYRLMTTVQTSFETDLSDTAGSEHIRIGYGCGLEIISRLGSDLYYHEGHIDSYYSFAVGIPECSFTLVLMSNYARENIETVASEMTLTFLSAYQEESNRCYPYSPTLSE
jgi:CubicO group peptidase (beta-lactamase class C family)